MCLWRLFDSQAKVLHDADPESPQGLREFFPSTNISHAWEVVEKVVGDGVVRIEVGQPTLGLVCVTISTDPAAPAWVTRGTAIAANAPHAICRAALKATEVK